MTAAPDDALPGWPPGPPPFELDKAVAWAWRKFRANSTSLVLGSLVVLGAGIVIYVAAFLAARSLVPDGRFFLQYDAETGAPQDLGAYVARMGLTLLLVFVLAIPLSVLSAGLVRMCLRIADGESPEFSDVFRVKNPLRIMTTHVLVLMASSIGLLFCYLPGLAFGVFAMFWMHMLLDRDLGSLKSIRASFGLVKHNIGNVLLVFIVCVAFSVAGTYACLIGMLVAGPVVMLIQVYAYRFLSGGSIAA